GDEEMVATMSEPETTEADIVHVPVPKHLLGTVYRALADAMATPGGAEAEGLVEGRNMVELVVDAGQAIDADQRPVSLTDLYNAYRRMYPNVGKGSSRGSFDATVNYYCINMRSRFPDAKNRRNKAAWLTNPAFKRVARGQYMLLTEQEKGRFLQAVEQNQPLVYEDEFDVDDLFIEA
ncbi:MAG: hypothetical protein JWO42_1245, partial [Chloroflexi bacterium]|nr:hypothetical protein [Chloroflexota bacterium]